MSSPAWRRSAAPGAAFVVAVLLLATGLVAARPDLALLGLPFAAVAATARPRRSAPADSTATVELRRGSPREVGYQLAVMTPAEAEMVELRLALPGRAATPLVVAADRARLEGTLPVLHSGPQRLLHVEHRLLAGDGDSTEQAPALRRDIVVAPVALPLVGLPLPRRLLGLTGGHETMRPGTGGEFRDIHPFAPGDRLRHIDWKATARRGRHPGDLYVRRTAATSDAAVTIVLDTRDDVGELVVDWSTGVGPASGTSSLDLAREAASSIAVAYLEAGDRVGVHDLGSGELVPSRGGRRHEHRVLRAIELVQPAPGRLDRRRAPALPAGALVFVLSTFLDGAVLPHCDRWQGAGHRVIAVDVLPGARLAGSTRAQRLGHRILLAEREDRLAALGARDVELLRWQDDLPQARAARWLALARTRRQSG